MYTKIALSLATALVIAGSSVAFAQSNRSDGRAVTSARHADARAALAQSQQLLSNGIVGDAVILDGRVIGRDPDAGVRLQMYRDWYNMHY